MKNKAGFIIKSLVILGTSLIFVVLIVSIISMVTNGGMILENIIGSHPPVYIVLPRFFLGQTKVLVNGILFGLACIGGAQIIVLYRRKRQKQ